MYFKFSTIKSSVSSNIPLGMSYSVLIFLSMALLFYCKEPSETRLNEQKPNTDIEKVHLDQIVFNCRIKVDAPDMIQLFYNERNDSQYSSYEYEEQWVSDTVSWQEITFALPPGIYPTHVRLDLGRNPAMSKVLLEELSMSYEGRNKYIFSPQEIISLFRPNFNVEMLQDEYYMKFNIVNKQEKYDPYISSNNLKGFTNKVIFGL